MKDQRHPHPHIDPRQPRNDTKPGTNPPVFAWKPIGNEKEFHLIVARDTELKDRVLDIPNLCDPLFLPEKAFTPCKYYWRWTAGGDRSRSEIFSFEIISEAVKLEIPLSEQWLKTFPSEHPRIFIIPEDVAALRESRDKERVALWKVLKKDTDAILTERHEIPEPPFLPDRMRDYQKWYESWYNVMWTSRRFVKGAEILALAYRASGQERYARAACKRMASISKWDPQGSSHLEHNDEAHMSVIWDGPKACDWVWDQFTDEERALVIEQFRKRGQITFDHMHNKGSYGVTRFDSHAGREIVFLAMIAFVFHEHIPEAQKWLKWLRPVLCGIWPIWAGDDGAWAEGPSYGLAYVSIMTMFATALKRGTGTDLYKKPFWKNHALWRQFCFPPYAQWMGFGDHTERWKTTWQRNANLVEIISRETGAPELACYISEFRKESEKCSAIPERAIPESYAQGYLSQATNKADPKPSEANQIHRAFPAAGWAAIRTDLNDASRDIAFIFRSSPYGSISHSHANNNDFIIHVAGKVMAMPSGYYDGYGTGHHAHWVRHTKANNCITLSDGGQLIKSHDSRGAVENSFEDDTVVYFRGNADASYVYAERCRRHVLFLKPHNCFVLIDEFVPAPRISTALQWNIHSWSTFKTDDKQRTFLIEREGSSLEGHFMYHHNAYFILTQGWDPPPMEPKKNDQWKMQHHLRFCLSTLLNYPQNLGTILCPGHASLERTNVVTERIDDTEIAHMGNDLVLINQGSGMKYEDFTSDALAMILLQRKQYKITDKGISQT